MKATAAKGQSTGFAHAEKMASVIIAEIRPMATAITACLIICGG